MEEVSKRVDQFGGQLAELWQQVIAYLPQLIGALVVLLVGWLIARLLRAATLRLGAGLNRLLDRFFVRGPLRRVRLSQPALVLVGKVIFWLIILISITLASRTADLRLLSSWLDGVVTYVPTLLAGGLIILAGFLVSILARELTAATLSSAGVSEAELIGRGVQGTMLVLALIIGIQQIGVDVTVLVILIGIVAATSLGGLSLAFGLGARALVGNLIGARYMQQYVHAGQIARVGEIEGEILELTPTGLILATERGRTTVPAKLFNELPVLLITPSQDDEH
ncbi:MAG: hypothetical protein QNJ94_10685 [Alphaproteobacteria bacterium]|nr:hypothetical protein [Alphaproteobacteria bacterium]